MTLISKSHYTLAFIDSLIIAIMSCISFSLVAQTYLELFVTALVVVFVVITTFILKGVYRLEKCKLKNLYILFESLLIGLFLTGGLLVPFLKGLALQSVLIDLVLIYVGILFCRVIGCLFSKIFKNVFKSGKNVLIVGAGQDGKLIAEEINQRPELGYKVVGFLDDNMNTIAEEDASIPILGLTCDTEAVVKDNNVDTIIIAVKSRMDSDILTDLAKGIPLGVEVWRMPTFYAHITQKIFTSKMSVNWLFYDYVRSKHILYSRIKKVLDIIFSIGILIVTLPLSLIAVIGIKLSDFGPIFFTQTRIGKFGKPFKMVKFRTMYQDKVDEDFDDDLEEIENNDKRIMPFCRLIRKFHIDDIPQMFNILRGEMSLIGPRPVREDVYEENRENIPFWECRNWVRPGLTGWQQINDENCIPEERLKYDLYYVKHRTLHWELGIFFRYIFKILLMK